MRTANRSFSRTRFAGFYFLFQGLLVGAWWILLWALPESRADFRPPGASEVELLAFAAPDLFLLVLGSVAAGGLALTQSSWAMPLGWLVAGAMDYATLYCIAWAALRGGGWVSVVAMAPAALLSTIAALDGSAGVVPIFRRATPASPTRNVAATAGQILVFWTFFLLFVPAGIAHVERALGVPPLAFPGREVAGWLLLTLASLLGLASGWALAAHGRGTPLPMDATNRLVTNGPYGHLRNPMVVAGLAQGVASGLLFGSYAVVAYVLTGGLIWQALVRPAEEEELATQFGAEFENYRAAVRCWMPTTRRYLPPS